MEPLVSICCLTYNHEEYIRDAIDGFLKQKTTFPIEVLIHDDASTDGTEKIIREYEMKYPEIIKPIYEKENQWLKGRSGSAVFNFPRARGKYIALCEGDDFWIDPYKLQKQIELMENNEGASLCFHNAVVKNYRTCHDSLFISKMNPEYNAFSLFRGKWFIPTASIVIRRELLPEAHNYPDWYKNSRGGDIAMQLYLSKYGKFISINQVMSVYRIFTLGSASDRLALGAAKRNLKNYSTTLIKANKEHFDSRYSFPLVLTLMKIKISLAKLFIKKFFK